MGHGALLIVQFLFGVFPIFGRVAMQPDRGFAPFTVAAGRVLSGAVVLGALAYWRHGRRALPPRGELPLLAGLSLLGIIANQTLFLLGLERSSATDAGVLVCVIPVFTWVVAMALGQERPDLRRTLGVLLAFAGLAPLLFARGATLAAEHALGNALMALNGLCYAAYLVLSKPLVARYPPLCVIAWIYALALPVVPFFLATAPLAPAAPGDAAVWWSLGFVVIFPTVVTYLFNLFALSRVRASTAAFYIYLQPVIAGLGGHFVLGERLHEALLPAAAGIVLGGLLVIRRPRR